MFGLHLVPSEVGQKAGEEQRKTLPGGLPVWGRKKYIVLKTERYG